MKTVADWMEVYRRRARLGPLRAVLDEADVEGLKNAYQNVVERGALKRALRHRTFAAGADLGCGVGRLSDLLAQRTRRVVGLDLSHELLEAGRPGWPSNFVPVRAELTSLPFRDACLDIVLASQAFMHLATPAGLSVGASEVARVLRPGGRAVLLEFLVSGPTARAMDGVAHHSVTEYVGVFEAAGLRLQRNRVIRQMPSLLVHWVRHGRLPRLVWPMAARFEAPLADHQGVAPDYREHLIVLERA